MNRVRELVRNMGAGLLYASGRTRPHRAAADRLTVVTFHRILPEESRAWYPLPGLAVPPDRLAEFLEFFRTHYECLPLSHAFERWQVGRSHGLPLLAVTFDDGQRDNYVHARPLLARYGIPATFFVSAANVSSGEPIWHDRLAFAVARLQAQLGADAADVVREILGADPQDTIPAAQTSTLARWSVARAKTLALDARNEAIQHLCHRVDGPLVPEWDGIMSWGELRTLAAAGHEIGSHAMTHALLLDEQGCNQRWEVMESKRTIERELGIPVRAFCYPNGSYDETTLREVEAAGYACAVTTQWGSNRRGTSPFELRRFDIQAERNQSPRGQVSPSVLAWRLADLRGGRS